MCETKTVIANSLKELMREKPIRKISVQDIMGREHMKRQSFYYHFKDIYEVLEWVCREELVEQIQVAEGESIEHWICNMIQAIERNFTFYRKIADECSWREIERYMLPYMKEQVEKLLGFSMKGHPSAETDMEEVQPVKEAVSFISTLLIYLLLGYVTKGKKMEEAIRENVRVTMCTFAYLLDTPAGIPGMV